MYKPHRYEWFTLAVVTLLVSVNTMLFDHNGSIIYWNRAVITFVGAIILLKRKTTLSFYHSIILLASLSMYAFLAYHVAGGTHGTMREFYTGVIHGLVVCQLLSIFPTLWAAYRNYITSRFTRLVHLQRDSRS
jgi:hypothetical protein